MGFGFIVFSYDINELFKIAALTSTNLQFIEGYLIINLKVISVICYQIFSSIVEIRLCNGEVVIMI